MFNFNCKQILYTVIVEFMFFSVLFIYSVYIRTQPSNYMSMRYLLKEKVPIVSNFIIIHRIFFENLVRSDRINLHWGRMWWGFVVAPISLIADYMWLLFFGSGNFEIRTTKERKSKFTEIDDAKSFWCVCVSIANFGSNSIWNIVAKN